MRIEYSECEQFRDLQMAVTTRSTFKFEWRGPHCASFPGRSVGGERSSEDVRSQSRLRSAGVWVKGVLDASTQEPDNDDSKLTAKRVGKK